MEILDTVNLVLMGSGYEMTLIGGVIPKLAGYG
jgi:hypothetical protein